MTYLLVLTLTKVAISLSFHFCNMREMPWVLFNSSIVQKLGFGSGSAHLRNQKCSSNSLMLPVFHESCESSYLRKWTALSAPSFPRLSGAVITEIMPIEMHSPGLFEFCSLVE